MQIAGQNSNALSENVSVQGRTCRFALTKGHFYGFFICLIAKLRAKSGNRKILTSRLLTY